MKKLVFFVLSSLLVFSATIYFRLGGHKSVQIQAHEYGELYLLSKSHQGPYHLINDTIATVEVWAREHNLPCPRTFGEYFDDPRQVDERQLRSQGGCILPQPLPQELLAALSQSSVAEKLQYEVRPNRQYVIATFDGAPSISPFKVYPKVEAYMRDNNLLQDGATIEIYRIISNSEAQTEYLFPYKSK